ncbi:MAG: hypothetical protein OXC66_15015 [Roseovarius sp.]|nr:hypothetical protein [Roseovarius sp.]
MFNDRVPLDRTRIISVAPSSIAQRQEIIDRARARDFAGRGIQAIALFGSGRRERTLSDRIDNGQGDFHALSRYLGKPERAADLSGDP